jgi:hypothetical protein
MRSLCLGAKRMGKSRFFLILERLSFAYMSQYRVIITSIDNSYYFHHADEIYCPEIKKR